MELQGLNIEDIIVLRVIIKKFNKELTRVNNSISKAKSGVANLAQYKGEERLVLDILNLDEKRDELLIVSIISNLSYLTFNIYLFYFYYNHPIFYMQI